MNPGTPQNHPAEPATASSDWVLPLAAAPSPLFTNIGVFIIDSQGISVAYVMGPTREIAKARARDLIAAINLLAGPTSQEAANG